MTFPFPHFSPHVDSFSSNVVFLTHFENNPAIDLVGHTWANTGLAQSNTGQSQFGTASYQLPGFPTGYGSTASSTDWNFGSGEFTIEFWIRYTTVVTGNTTGIILRDQIGGTRGWLVFKQDNLGGNNNELAAAVWVGGTSYVLIDSIRPIQNFWYYYAFVRDQSSGDVIRLYRDGVQTASNSSVTGSVGAPSEPMVCGMLWGVGNPIASSELGAFVDELRITKGVCRYRSGTTFSVPTSAFAYP